MLCYNQRLKPPSLFHPYSSSFGYKSALFSNSSQLGHQTITIPSLLAILTMPKYTISNHLKLAEINHRKLDLPVPTEIPARLANIPRSKSRSVPVALGALILLSIVANICIMMYPHKEKLPLASLVNMRTAAKTFVYYYPKCQLLARGECSPEECPSPAHLGIICEGLPHMFDRFLG